MIDIIRSLGSYITQKGGEELVFKCPKCGRRKFYVNTKKRLAHCFRCTYSKRFPRMVKNLLRKKQEPVIKTSFIERPEVQSEFTELASNYLKSRHIDPSWAVANGWGSWLGRIFIPIIEEGKLVCWVARAYQEGQEPKELSAPNRSIYLYNYDSIMKGDKVILVEGIFDCLAIQRLGFKCLALMGSNISDTQIGKLIRLAPTRITLMMDGDAAGRKANIHIKSKLSKRINPMLIDIYWLPDNIDPDDLQGEGFEKSIYKIYSK